MRKEGSRGGKEKEKERERKKVKVGRYGGRKGER